MTNYDTLTVDLVPACFKARKTIVFKVNLKILKYSPVVQVEVIHHVHLLVVMVVLMKLIILIMVEYHVVLVVDQQLVVQHVE